MGGRAHRTGTTLVTGFRASARAQPERPALYAAGELWTYRQLAAAAARVARLLTDRAPPGGRIGVLSPKTGWAYGALLGVLGSGRVHVPLTPDQPPARLARIAALARLDACLVDPSCRELAAQLGYGELGYGELDYGQLGDGELGDGHLPLPEGEPPGSDAPPLEALLASLDRVPGPDSPAYLLFTSGSTGEPKGVPVTHGNGAACIEAVCRAHPVVPEDRCLQLAGLGFDFALGEIFTAWQGGAALYAPSAAERMMPERFVATHGITVWSSVPTLAESLVRLGAIRPGGMPSLRRAQFCGEALHRTLAEAFRAAAPEAEVVNLYGPTEASIYATHHVYDPAADREPVVPLGRPLEGFRLRIEDAEGRPGDAGELLLAGPQVVAGYWGRPEATARSFVRRGDDPETVWYRTGDRVRRDGRGVLHFRGRIDHQVQVRGHRVELQEVEAVLRRVVDGLAGGAPGTAPVGVVPWRPEPGAGDDAPDDNRCEDLMAFVAWPEGGAPFDEEALREGCAEQLPPPMVPARIVPLDPMPVNANGKIDRRALARRARQARGPAGSAGSGTPGGPAGGDREGARP